MPETVKTEPNNKKPRLGCFGKGCLLLLLLFMLAGSGVVWHVQSWKESLTAENEAMLAQLRADGYPTTLDELDQYYAYPASGTNGAHLWEDAFRLLPQENDIPKELPLLGDGDIPDLDKRLSAEQLVLVKDFINKHQDLLAAIHQAAAQDAPCRFPIDLRDGLDTELPHLSLVRSLARVLSLVTLHMASESPNLKVDTIHKNFIALEMLADSLTEEPVYISLLVRIAVERTNREALQRIVCTNQQFWETIVQKTLLTSKTEDASEQLKRVVIAETISGLDVFQKIFAGATSIQDTMAFSVPKYRLGALFERTGHLAEDQNYYMKTMFSYIVACKETPYKRVDITKNISAGSLNTTIPNIHCMRFISDLVLPTFEGLFEAEAKNLASWRTIHAAMAVERYRQAKGELPVALADLVPAFLDAVPEDPFDGKPLRYKKTSPGFVVYSVGADRKDDGGTDSSFPETLRHEPDVIFVVPH